MANRKYIEDFRMLRIDEQQHNIMTLVGNGFDIQVLNSLNKHIKTSYYDFYNFLVCLHLPLTSWRRHCLLS